MSRAKAIYVSLAIAFFLGGISLMYAQSFNGKELTPENISVIAKQADTEQKRAEFVQTVFKSKKLDLIKSCYQIPDLAGVVNSSFNALPASGFKNEVLLVMMEKKPSWYYSRDKKNGKPPPPNYNKLILLSRNDDQLNMLIEVLASKLPNEALKVDDPISLDRVHDYDTRMALIGKYRDAVAGRSSRSNGIESSIRTPRRPDTPNADAETQTKREKNNVQHGTTASSDPQNKWLIMLAVVLVLGIVFVWLRAKSRA